MLKKTVLCLGLLLVAAFPCIPGAATPINSAGYYKNIKLCGKVKIVDSFPDIKVKVVDSFPDLKVKVVQSFPNNIGEWQFVEYGEDFRVQFVDSFPDIKSNTFLPSRAWQNNIHMSCQKCWQLFFYAIFKVNALLKKYSLGVLYV